jgi:DNA-binding XRE family transcriptional regulator
MTLSPDPPRPSADSDILIFRSARPGWSFETWLFQRLTPRDRRALTAAITVYGRHWTSDAALPGSPRRRGPQLREVTVRFGLPACRSSARRDGSGRAGGWPPRALRVFCLLASTGPVVIAAGDKRAGGPGVQRDPALGRARRLARELQDAQGEGNLSRILCLDSFEAIRAQCRAGRTIAWDRQKRAGLVAFDDVKALVIQEAALEGPSAGMELREDEARYCLGVEILLLRAARGFTQRQLASLTGIPQSTISEIESGQANPTLAILAELAGALDGRVGLLSGVELGS